MQPPHTMSFENKPLFNQYLMVWKLTLEMNRNIIQKVTDRLVGK